MRNSLKNVCKLLQQATETVPVETSFLSDLKRSIELTDKQNTRKPSQTYKPSSMNCIRNMYYQVTGVEQDAEETPYTLIGICNAGTDIHERIQKSVAGMKLNGIDCTYVDVAEYVTSRNLDYLDIVSQQGMETKLFHKNLNMSFLCDGIIKYKGKYYILELKTEASFKFLDRKGVDPSHYMQGTAYSIAFGIDDVIFVYISRDTLDMKAYMFTPTDDMKQELLGKIANCDACVKQGIAPAKPEGLSQKTCNYCEYKGQCRKDG